MAGFYRIAAGRINRIVRGNMDWERRRAVRISRGYEDMPVSNIATKGLPTMAMDALFAGLTKLGVKTAVAAGKGAWRLGKYGVRSLFANRGGIRQVGAGVAAGVDVTATAGLEVLRGAKTVLVRDVPSPFNPQFWLGGGAKKPLLNMAHMGIVNGAPVLGVMAGVSMGQLEAARNQPARTELARAAGSVGLDDLGATGQLALSLHHLSKDGFLR